MPPIRLEPDTTVISSRLALCSEIKLLLLLLSRQSEIESDRFRAEAIFSRQLYEAATVSHVNKWDLQLHQTSHNARTHPQKSSRSLSKRDSQTSHFLSLSPRIFFPLYILPALIPIAFCAEYNGQTPSIRPSVLPLERPILACTFVHNRATTQNLDSGSAERDCMRAYVRYIPGARHYGG